MNNPIKSKKIGFLEVSSWAGISIGASHVYGKLLFKSDDEERGRLDITRELTQELAEELNKKDSWADWTDYVGEPTNRFDDLPSLRAAAAKLAEEKNLSVLLEGSPVYVMAFPVVWVKDQEGKEGVLSEMETLRKEFERLEDKEDYSGSEKVHDEWLNLLGQIL
jgi:hypothetical protein